jgi:deazaflavin-dependent oxidoreductase (nitroreductase family)
MNSQVVPISERPRGITRLLFRLPIWLYRARLGWLLGDRFLMLTHLGRKSGLPRQTVVEVVRHDKATDTYFIVSGFGEQSDWYRNIRKNPRVTVQVGGRRMDCMAEQLGHDDAVHEFRNYARRHPAALKTLSRVLRYPWDGTEASYHALAQLLPIMALRPPAR